MKNFILLSVLTIFIGAALILGGCSKNSPTEPDQSGDATELDLPYGGFNASDELPAFGEASIAADFGDDENVNDLISTDPSFASDLNSSGITAYYIRITWGLLKGDSTATEMVNWNGSATISRGKLGIMKTILFERNQNDHVVLPRSDRRTVQWVSNTVTHFDGILLVILDKDTTLNVPGKFTFNTALCTKTFRFDELDSLQLIETVTQQGHQVSIQAHSKQIIRLGGGFVEGKWIKTRPHGGDFRGRWINEVGTRVGHVKGIWGINRFGEKVFFGKYVGLNGQFGGLLTGNWGYDSDETVGWFKGRWVNRSLTTVGIVEGHWKVNPDRPGQGFFHGKWRKKN